MHWIYYQECWWSSPAAEYLLQMLSIILSFTKTDFNSTKISMHYHSQIVKHRMIVGVVA